MYNTAAPGGGPAPVVSFANSPEIAEIRRLSCAQILIKGMDSGVTTLNLYNAAAPSLKEEISVIVADFPEVANYGRLSIYLPAESPQAYTDGEYSLTFDSPSELLKGGTIWIYDAESGEAADILCFNDERQITAFKINNNIFVGDQLVRVEGNTVY